MHFVLRRQTGACGYWSSAWGHERPGHRRDGASPPLPIWLGDADLC